MKIRARERIKKTSDRISERYGRLKYLIGMLLIVFGVFAMVTPFTPGAFLALAVGLEVVGFNLVERNWKFWRKDFLRIIKKEEGEPK